jgi:hypothetical protein
MSSDTVQLLMGIKSSFSILCAAYKLSLCLGNSFLVSIFMALSDFFNFTRELETLLTYRNYFL